MQLSLYSSGYRDDVKATSMVVVLSTVEVAKRRQSRNADNHNPATLRPHWCPNCDHQWQ